MRTVGDNEAERAVLAAIATQGYHVVHVLEPREGEPTDLTYTVGLWATFGQPEVLVAGPRAEIRAAVVGAVVEACRVGMHLQADERIRLSSGHDALLVTAEPARLPWATWYYDGAPFPCVEMLLDR